MNTFYTSVNLICFVFECKFIIIYAKISDSYAHEYERMSQVHEVLGLSGRRTNNTLSKKVCRMKKMILILSYYVVHDSVTMTENCKRCIYCHEMMTVILIFKKIMTFIFAMYFENLCGFP